MPGWLLKSGVLPGSLSIATRDSNGCGPRKPHGICLRIWCLRQATVLSLLIGVAASGIGSLSAQDSSEQSGALRLPTSSLVEQSVRQLREQIRNNQTQEAADTFRRLSTSDPGLLLPRQDTNQYVPPYQILGDEFERFPETLRTLLREANDLSSRTSFVEAVRQEQWEDLVLVMHEFPGSDGAQLARLLLAQAHLDRGHDVAAQHWLNQLAESSLLSAELRSAVNELQRRIERWQSDDPDHPREDHHSSSVRVSPPEWHIRWTQREDVAKQIHQVIGRSLFSGSSAAASSWNAVIHDGLVFRRTLRGLTALDIHTGVPQWNYRLSPNHLQYLKGIPGFDSADGEEISSLGGSFLSMLLHDGALNSIQTGRQAVYAVVAQQTNERISMRMGQESVRKRAQLVAVSQQDGRRQWTIGGPPLESQFPVALSDTWFAGPPVAAGDLLFGIVEQESEIRLVTLRQRTGEVVNSTVLAFSDTTIGQDTPRSLVAATPVIVGGLILCPTTTGWLIAVDQLTHTVIWATRTRRPDVDQADFDRDNIRFMMTQHAETQSPHTGIHVLGSSAVVIPWDSQELLLLDIPTGISSQPQERREYSGIIATTNAGVVVAMEDESTLQRLDVLANEVIWECHIPELNGIPQGTGVVQAGHLLVGTSIGALLTLDIETGAIVSATPDMLPPSVPGILLDASENRTSEEETTVRNLVFISPDETTCLTTELNLPDSQETSARVARLIDEHACDQAWDILDSISETAYKEDRQLAELRFEAAFGLAVTRTLPPSIDLQSLAVTVRQEKLARVFAVSQSFTEEPSAAANAAIQLANEGQSWLTIIPTALLVDSDDVAELSEQAMLSTGSWAAHLIEHALKQDASLADDGSFTELLASLPSETLVRIQHSAAAEVIRARLTEIQDPEQAVHLLVHLARLNSNLDALASELNALPLMKELPSGQRLLAGADQLQNPNVRQLAIQRILAAVSTEEELELLESVSDEIAAQDESRLGWEETWNSDDYMAVPFARPQPSRRRSIQLQLSDCRDPLLSALTFKLHRNPQRLSIQSAAPDTSEIWSVTGSLPGDTGIVSSTQVSRFGSIVMLQSPTHLVAVSLLDQRVLWQYESVVSERLTMLQTPFNTAFQDMPSEYTGFIAPRGTTFDWVCLKSPESIRVVDALTGLVRWTFVLPDVESDNKIVVDEEYILISTGDSIIAMEPRFGVQIPHQITMEQFEETLYSHNAHVVIREPSEDDSELSLVWKNPLTGKILRAITIQGTAKIQRPTEERLAVIHANRNATTVDLTTGDMQQYPWTELATSSTDAWTAELITYVEDKEYVYLIHQPTARQMHESMRGRIPHRQMSAFTGIRVLDRQTGEHLWEYILPDGESARVVTDQLSLPFLATIQRPVDSTTRKPLGWVTFRCFNKRSGKLLVDSRLPMRFSYDELRISQEANQSIDLNIHGTHVRFERPGFPTIRRPGQ